MMAYMRFKSKKVVSEEVLSLASNKKYILRNGEVVGKHQGLIILLLVNGLNVGGNKDPLFIIATNVETNTIYTGLSSQHPGLFRKGLFIEKIKYIGFGMI
jgi:tRNA-specific 2-thiouridylase